EERPSSAREQPHDQQCRWPGAYQGVSEQVLHGYWRSGTSYRTRIALGIKGLDYRQEPVDLREGAQKSEAFRALNPQGLVPALETPDGVLTQSSAIIEWVDERYPDPPLFPA